MLVPKHATTGLNAFEGQRTWLRHRGVAMRLFQSTPVQDVLLKINAEVDGKRRIFISNGLMTGLIAGVVVPLPSLSILSCRACLTLLFACAAGRLAVRSDRSPFADVGLRDSIVTALLSYSPAYLLLGLETVFGVTLVADAMVHSREHRYACAAQHGWSWGWGWGLSWDATMAHGCSLCHQLISVHACRALCSEFIASHVLFDSSLAAKHATSPDTYGPGFEPALKATTLKRFLALVFLLDQVRRG